MRSSLTRFIPTNEAGAGFAGDATGLRGGVVAGRGCVVASLRSGWPPERARLSFHARFTLTARAGDTGFTRVSRAAKADPQVSRSQPAPATPISRAFHAHFTRHQRHGAHYLRPDQEAPHQHSHPLAVPRAHTALPNNLARNSSTPQPHDASETTEFQHSVFNLRRTLIRITCEILKTASVRDALHPLRSITPDQSGCNAH